MSNVSLKIGGRDYAVACAAGEEAHVASLGQMIDAKVQSVGAATHSETRQLLFAALLLADQVHEMSASGSSPAPSISERMAERLEAIAERLETCAQALEG